MDKKFEISQENQKKMLDAIKKFFLEERNEDLGDLAAMIILDFFTEHLAKEFYNQGIYDSYKYMNERVEGLFEIQKY
ncbi:DUF2164 domain-containing protein [Sporosalibacterium faouarense]|uniref:DUF2164 domain-containing protein n=1 Tax=Sporosalibacterium faouarense TaxID=516123 RepID=UPI00141D1A7F|nr:DUF2164 domain-containing protein [Sporosalibacterium faouarense]MTI47460.1 DUF2164 domain-containing protein [Bacillota bacterium]